MTPLNTDLEKRYMDIIEDALGVIANAGTSLGDWGSMHPEWQKIAVRWRDEMWHPILNDYCVRTTLARYEAALDEIASCDHPMRVHMGPEIAREALGIKERTDPPMQSPNRAPDTGAQLRELDRLRKAQDTP